MTQLTQNNINHNTQVSSHYDANYYNWHKNIGEVGGKVNACKFKKSITPNDTVIDFGCGGGFLLKNLNCKKRIGIEPNPSAAVSVKQFGIQHFSSPGEALKELGHEAADVIISNNALEHTLNPLQELKDLRPLLKKGGIIHFVVPCDSINYKYDPNNINYHLFSWSPQNLGNIFHEAGYKIDYVRPYIHKWPPYHTKFVKLGLPLFNFISKIYGRIERSWFQVEIKAVKE